MNKQQLQKYFEEKYLKGTCFDTLKDLLNDRTDYRVNIVRCLIAVELKGVWRGLQELSKKMENVDEKGRRYISQI